MTIYVGTMGERGSGKSELGRMLRDLAGSSSAADLEYSDLMMEAANQALQTGYRTPAGFVWQLQLAAERVAQISLGERPLEWFTATRPDVQAGLETWLEGPGARPHVRVTRANKLTDGHVPVLVWLGVFIRHPELGGPTVYADAMARRLDRVKGEPLVTVGGCRFPEDPKPVCDHHGVIVDILRHQVTGDLDPTNQHRAKIEADIIVNNHADLAELHEVAAELYADLTSDRSLRRSSGVPHVYGRPYDMVTKRS